MKVSRRVVLGSAGAFLFAPNALSPAGAQEVRRGGTVVIGSTQVPRHLNPTVQSGIATALPGTQIFASLLRYDADWKPHPYLAKSWEVAPDGLSVTVRIVENATFHDGKPITSEDVKFSIETVKAHHPFKTMYAPVTAVETPDAHTAVVRLEHPHPALLLAMSSALLVIIPKHVYGDGQDVRTHPANAAPVGSGPFKVAEFVPGQHVILEKNPEFFLKGKPYLDKVIIRIVKDPSALLIAVENGEVDMYPFLSTAQDIKRLEGVERLAVTDEGYAAIGPINWLAFNCKKAPLDDVKVRQAISYAVDRQTITKALMRGVAKPQSGPIVESSPFFNKDIPSFAVDLDKANALLDEAGHKADAQGIRFPLTVDYLPGENQNQKNVAEYLKSQLKKIGIDVVVRASPDFPTWAKRVSNYDFDMTMDIVFNWGDPVIGVHRTYLSSNIVQGVIWSNTQQYSNPKVDDLLAKAAVELDEAKRKALYDEFQVIVREDSPIHWINLIPYHTAYDTRLANVPVSIWGTLQSLDDLYWKEPRT